MPAVYFLDDGIGLGANHIYKAGDATPVFSPPDGMWLRGLAPTADGDLISIMRPPGDQYDPTEGLWRLIRIDPETHGYVDLGILPPGPAYYDHIATGPDGQIYLGFTPYFLGGGETGILDFGTNTSVFSAGDGGITDVEVSPDGSLVALVEDDYGLTTQLIRVDPSTGDVLESSSLPYFARDATVDPDGRVFLVAGAEWESADSVYEFGQEAPVYAPPAGHIFAIGSPSSGDVLAVENFEGPPDPVTHDPAYQRVLVHINSNTGESVGDPVSLPSVPYPWNSVYAFTPETPQADLVVDNVEASYENGVFAWVPPLLNGLLRGDPVDARSLFALRGEATIQNVGRGPAGPFKAVFYSGARADTKPGDADYRVLGASGPLGGVEAGEQIDVTVEDLENPLFFRTDSGQLLYQDGYYIGVWADGFEEVPETNEENNQKAVEQCDTDAALFGTAMSFLSDAWRGLGLTTAAVNLDHYLSGAGGTLSYGPTEEVATEIAQSTPFQNTVNSTKSLLNGLLFQRFRKPGSYNVSDMDLPGVDRPYWGLSDTLDLGLAIGGVQNTSEGLGAQATFSGRAAVVQTPMREVLQYRGELTFVFRDRYEFDDRDVPKSPFDAMARLLENCGVARPFNTSYTVTFPVSEQIVLGGGRGPNALRAAGGPHAGAPSAGPLTTAQLRPIIREAIRRWNRTGLTTAESQLLRSATVQIADLDGATLGLTSGTAIAIDRDAAGYGWFVDKAPRSDAEFRRKGDQGERDHMDLLTAVIHELGHVLGRDHSDGGAMAETLATGTREAIVPTVNGGPGLHTVGRPGWYRANGH